MQLKNFFERFMFFSLILPQQGKDFAPLRHGVSYFFTLVCYFFTQRRNARNEELSHTTIGFIDKYYILIKTIDLIYDDNCCNLEDY